MVDLPYRPNVCMLVLNSANKLFLGERCGNPGVWQFPQGGVEKDLSLEDNVLKELTEELGADISFFSIIKKLSSTHQYDFLNPPDYAKGVWRGQSQTFWLVRFSGRDEDLNLNRYQPEFMGFEWLEPQLVPEKAEKRRISGYLPALQECIEYLKEQGTNI